MELRWYQREAVDEAYNFLCTQEGNPVVCLPTGCHAAGHLILMANGDLKAVEDVAVGELVMGPDGKPREVLNLCRGYDDLFLITPIKGEPFVVNGDHILYLECTNEGKKAKSPSHRRGGEVDCISVREYLSKAKSWKHLRKLRWCDPIEFPETKSNRELFDLGYEIPPYIVGLMLGDGHMKHSISLTTADQECADAFCSFAQSHGWSVNVSRKPNNAASQYAIVSNSRGKTCPARMLFDRVGLLNHVGSSKAIPKKYVISPKQVRLEVLAGLIDSDGYHDGSGGYEFSNKSERVCRGVAYIAKSLGLRAIVSIVRKRSQTSSKRIYWKVSISGDTSEIPCKLERKKPPERRQVKFWLRSGFKVQPFGKGNFYGFTLSGDHLYVDGNFLIHHNSGKSLVIAELARRAVQEFQGRVLILQHRKELIQQNTEKVRKLLDIPVGEYSAGLRRFATAEDVVLCGIQSVYNKATLFDRRHLVIIDESHLVPTADEGMYNTFLSDMRQANPGLRVIGLTATPFRTGEGALCRPNGMFQKICYNAEIKRLIEEGWLCRVTNKPSQTHFDTSGLHMRYGEFITRELESLFGGEQVAEACKEIIEKTADRHSIMVFCTSIRHAASVVSTLEKLTGQEVAMVEGGTLPLERSSILDRFKSGSLRWLVNVDVLTTGFDSPNVDAICILRATASPGLFAQIVGRGLRVHPSKQDCLVLDFGENIERHGSIDAIDYGKPKERKARNGEPDEPSEGRECPNCTLIIPKKERTCECGFTMPHREPNHQQYADTQAEILSTHEPETFTVSAAAFTRHEKQGKQPSLRVTYQLEDVNMPYGLSEWVCIEHMGYARSKAELWWREHCSLPCPDSIDEAIDLFQRGWVAIPKSVTAVREGKFRRITAREIEELPVGVEVGEVQEEEMPF